mmetsp:Transcript_34505/g.81802  ORF Transcript_34505/g.81802 Transcript_34505/m.81802 type:complete len:203 (-) Transcript_34505:92-700(-)
MPLARVVTRRRTTARRLIAAATATAVAGRAVAPIARWPGRVLPAYGAGAVPLHPLVDASLAENMPAGQRHRVPGHRLAAAALRAGRLRLEEGLALGPRGAWLCLWGHIWGGGPAPRPSADRACLRRRIPAGRLVRPGLSHGNRVRRALKVLEAHRARRRPIGVALRALLSLRDLVEVHLHGLVVPGAVPRVPPGEEGKHPHG